MYTIGNHYTYTRISPPTKQSYTHRAIAKTNKEPTTSYLSIYLFFFLSLSIHPPIHLSTYLPRGVSNCQDPDANAFPSRASIGVSACGERHSPSSWQAQRASSWLRQLPLMALGTFGAYLDLNSYQKGSIGLRLVSGRFQVGVRQV